MAKYFKAIEPSNFVTFKKSTVTIFVIIMALYLIAGKVIFMYFVHGLSDFSIRTFLVINVLDYYVAAMGLMLGFALPFVLNSYFAYVPLWFGFESLIYFVSQYADIKVKIASYSTVDRVIVMAIALALTIVYAAIVIKTRPKEEAEEQKDIF